MIQVFHLMVNEQHRWYCNLKKDQALAHGFGNTRSSLGRRGTYHWATRSLTTYGNNPV